jgi:hypothetical protein
MVNDGVRATKSPLEKYMDRPEEFKDITFLRFLKRVDFRNAKKMRRLRSNTTDRILKYFPQYKSGQQPEDLLGLSLCFIILSKSYRILRLILI